MHDTQSEDQNHHYLMVTFNVYPTTSTLDCDSNTYYTNVNYNKDHIDFVTKWMSQTKFTLDIWRGSSRLCQCVDMRYST
jgi:hypothetical protein